MFNDKHGDDDDKPMAAKKIISDTTILPTDRLIRLETEFDSIRDDVETIGKNVRILNETMHTILSRVEGIGKTDPKQLTSIAASVLGVLVIVVGGLWGMAIAPISERVDRTADTVQAHIQTGSHPGTLEKFQALGERFKEVETQFRAADTVRNLEIQNLREKIHLLWGGVYKETLPDRSYWPEIGQHSKNGLNGNSHGK